MCIVVELELSVALFIFWGQGPQYLCTVGEYKTKLAKIKQSDNHQTEFPQ